MQHIFSLVPSCFTATSFCHMPIILKFMCITVYCDSRGQAEKEFKVEVEAIGKVRHKNLVRLVGYCAEGARRYCFVYVTIILLT
jgi:hypothetical protein